jgi:ribosomal protein S4
MFKLFALKYKNKFLFIKYLLRKRYLKFNYPRIMPMKKKRIFYTKDYIVRLHQLLRFRVYYSDKTIVKFKKYLKRINRRRLDFETSICFLLETRLDILLFRLNFAKSPREAREYIERRKIKINNVTVKSLNHQLCIHDVITFEKDMINFFLGRLEVLINDKKILFNYPRYLEMCFFNMKCMLISYPKRKYIPTT